MRNYVLLLFLGFSLFTAAQDKIIFDYDASGNQINRKLCLSANCDGTGYKTKAPKEIAALQEEDLEKFFPEDVISYYPNPVKEELYLKWELVKDKSVVTIYLDDLNGRIIQTYNNLAKVNNLNIPFYNYPRGTYLVVLVYNNGEHKTIKIEK